MGIAFMTLSMVVYTVHVTYLIYRVIHNTEDHQALQRDLTTLSKWADKWQMAFNIK